MAKSFPLKKGYCHIDDESLMISMAEKPYKVKNSKFNFQLIFFGAMFLLTVFFAVRFANKENSTLSLIYGIGAGIIGLNLVLNWNKSQDVNIKISDICYIEYKQSGALTNDFFIVKYCVNGKTRNRMLMLPKSVKNNPKELQKAKKYLSSITDLRCDS